MTLDRALCNKVVLYQGSLSTVLISYFRMALRVGLSAAEGNLIEPYTTIP